MKLRTLQERVDELKAQCFAEDSTADDVWALFDEMRGHVREFLRTRDLEALMALEEFEELK